MKNMFKTLRTYCVFDSDAHDFETGVFLTRAACRHVYSATRGATSPTRAAQLDCCSHIATYLKVKRKLIKLTVKKGKFLYSAVSSPQDRSKRFTLYFPDRPVHSDTISASLGSIQPYATINVRRLLVHISTTVCSQVLIYTAE